MDIYSFTAARTLTGQYTEAELTITGTTVFMEEIEKVSGIYQLTFTKFPRVAMNTLKLGHCYRSWMEAAARVRLKKECQPKGARHIASGTYAYSSRTPDPIAYFNRVAALPQRCVSRMGLVARRVATVGDFNIETLMPEINEHCRNLLLTNLDN